MTTCLRSCNMNAIGDACKFTMKRSCMDLSRYQSRSYRMNANSSSFNSLNVNKKIIFTATK